MKTIKEEIRSIVHKALGQSIECDQIGVDYPKNPKFGDYATSVCLTMGKQSRVLAEKTVQKIKALGSPLFSKIEVAGPGFINFFLTEKFLLEQVNKINKEKEKYLRTNIGKGKKVQIEFISANPTGPLTVGNGRGGYLGDVLGNVMKLCGFNITREYLINDAGSQITILGHSVLKDEQAAYQGEYIDKLHQSIKKGDPNAIGQRAAKIILNQYIKKTVEKNMNIKFDVWFSEQQKLRSTKAIEKITKWLKQKKFTYEKDGAVWFKSSAYGDDKDRVLIRKSNEPTYFAQDFAYHKNKFDRKFDRVINIWGADHHGDVKRLLAAAEVLGHRGKLKIILTQFIRLIKNGKEVRMSKRAGNLVYMDDLIKEVGKDVTRFYFLKYSPDSHIDFDLNQAKEWSEKNPVFYVQYAYARACNVLKQIEVSKLPKTLPLKLATTYELDLIKEFTKLPDVLQGICENYQVQNLALFATNMAEKFHQFYTNCRVINEHEVDWSRVRLMQATKIILKELFETLGIDSPEKM